MNNIMDLKSFKQKLLKNPDFRKEYYNRDDLIFEISSMVEEERIRKGLTQKELADLVKTKQSSIARLERGISLPSLSFLQKIAESLGTHLISPKFASSKNYSTTITQKNEFNEKYPTSFIPMTYNYQLLNNSTANAEKKIIQ